MTKQYYSTRTNNSHKKPLLTLKTLKRVFLATYQSFDAKEYFQQAFGYHCVDNGFVPGTIIIDVGIEMESQIYKPAETLWPIENRAEHYTKDDLFDVIEFLHEWVSKPTEGYYHGYDNCGWHYDKFDKEEGQEEYRNKINGPLSQYENGYKLSGNGEIQSLAPAGLEILCNKALPTFDPDNVEERVNTAITKFKNRSSTVDDRQNAVRDLVDVLEFLRKDVKTVLLTKDENDLFNIANNFGIRHHNGKQKNNYDKAVWYSWMFYHYLATIHAVRHLIERKKDNN